MSIFIDLFDIFNRHVDAVNISSSATGAFPDKSRRIP
jgi:hypothetical protein